MNAIINKSRSAQFSLAAAMAALIFTASPISPAAAGSKHCKKVYVQVINQTGGRIKVIDLDYYDPAAGRWRSEPVPNEVIPNNGVWQETRRLEKVNQLKTRLRVDYRELTSKGKWGKKRSKVSTAKTCSKGKEFTISL